MKIQNKYYMNICYIRSNFPYFIKDKHHKLISLLYLKI